jgi:cytochrome c biogenesis protein CcmG/thiol:disulfide interchange protein DsbE
MIALRYLLPLAVFALIAGFLWSGLYKDPHIVPSPLIGKPAPVYSLPALHDSTRVVSAVALRGKPYLLNVFASWCVACREEHQTLAAFARSGLVPVIGLDWKDPHDDALRWLAQLGDPYGDIAIDFGVYGAPESFLIDGAGTIRHKVIGPLTPEIIEKELKPRIAQLQGRQP